MQHKVTLTHAMVSVVLAALGKLPLEVSLEAYAEIRRQTDRRPDPAPIDPA